MLDNHDNMFLEIYIELIDTMLVSEGFDKLSRYQIQGPKPSAQQSKSK
jgi:hypothetical protein